MKARWIVLGAAISAAFVSITIIPLISMLFLLIIYLNEEVEDLKRLTKKKGKRS
jgi:hypothetical protein